MAEVNSTDQPARDALFNHPEEWARFQQQAVHGQAVQGAPVESSKSGLFHNPQKWGEYLKQSMLLNAAVATAGGEGMSLRQPVFYHPEMWETYKKETAARVRSAQKAPVKDALLYHREDWEKYGQTEGHKDGRYARGNVRVIAAGKFRAGDPAPIREALLHHPENWGKFEQAKATAGKRLSVRAGARTAAHANTEEYHKAYQVVMTPRTASATTTRRLKTAAAPA